MQYVQKKEITIGVNKLRLREKEKKERKKERKFKRKKERKELGVCVSEREVVCEKERVCL